MEDWFPVAVIIIFFDMWKRRGSASLESSAGAVFNVEAMLVGSDALTATFAFVRGASPSGPDTWMMGLTS
jgi:hypothetical protein